MRPTVIFYLLVIGSALCAGGRIRNGKKSKRIAIPIYRSLGNIEADNDAPITTETDVGPAKRPNNDANEGRFLKHFLLLQSLRNSNQNNNSGLVPYVVVNSPATLTNLNSNIITNSPTTATTGTATGTGGTGGGGGGEGRIGKRNKVPMRLAVPYEGAYNIPTPIYHQRNQPLPQIFYGPPPNSLRRGNRNRNNKVNVRRNPFASLASNLRRLQYF